MVRFPVSVRISDGVTDRHVTGYVSRLRYKITAPGGFHSASMTLHVDPSTLSDLGPADRLFIYGPTGATLWEGFIDNPGRLAGDEGVGFDLSVTGTLTLADDQSRAYVYVDRDLSEWEPYAKNQAIANATTSTNPTNDADQTQGLFTGLNNGQVAATNALSQIGYFALVKAGLQFGAISAAVRSGKTDTGYRTELVYGPPTGVNVVANSGGISTNAATFTRVVGEAGNPPSGTNAVAVRLRRTDGPTNIADDNTWTWWSNIAVLGRRVDRFGVLVTGAAGMISATHVRGDWVAEDLLGRVLTLCDPNGSTIEAASYLIDQLTYHDGATAADVLDDLAVFEPDMLWEILHSTSAGYVFNYRSWPTTVRYELSTRDGYDAPGGDVDLCNRITVRWTDPKGLPQTKIVYAASSPAATVGPLGPMGFPIGAVATVFSPSLKALEDAGRIRDAETVTLPDGRGSDANAQRAGEQVLAAKADPPKAATVTVRQPVTDLLRGGWAKPYDLQPGYLARVRETGDVLRVTEVEVDDEAGVAVLTLGEPVLTEEQRFARLTKVTSRVA
jgi:hypothetical protein